MNTGSFNLILGSMFSGKTSLLISRWNRYTLGGKKCLMIKYKNDTRYDKYKVVSHDNISIKAVVCEYLMEVDHLTTDFDVVLVDEIQFYKDASIFCDKWANEGKIVEACGLNGTFNRKPFETISKLIPLVENISFIKAICKENGNDAVYSKRLTDDIKEEVIGGSDIYSATDRKQYFKDKDLKFVDYQNKFVQLIDVFAEANKIQISEELKKEFMEYFDVEFSKYIKEKKYNIPFLKILKECFVYVDPVGRAMKYLDKDL